jgi:carboxylesterase
VTRLRTPAVLALAAYVARALSSRRAEREVAARLPLGADGVVRGAGAIDLAGDAGGRAALLLHGFGDTPQTLAYLAAHLSARGWAVRAPLLPGHGRTLRAFSASGAAEWIGAARAEYAAACERHGARRVALVGLSMGGALASIVAADAGAGLPALALLAPYTAMPPSVRRVARVAPVLGLVLPYLSGRGARSIYDPDERTRSLAYGATPPRLVRELAAVVRAARAALPRVVAPTLVVHSRTDHRIPVAAAAAAFDALGAADPELVWLDGCGHVVTVDFGRERVFEAVADWLESRVRGAQAPARRA